jgi:lycopene beta-cyclase
VADVVVAGGGPAGWSLAAACAELGLRVTLVTPTTTWRATYGMWLDEVAVLPAGARYVTARARAGDRWLTRRYVVLDNPTVLAGFAHRDIEVITSRASTATPEGLRLTDGTLIPATTVVDATGTRAALTPPTTADTTGTPTLPTTVTGTAGTHATVVNATAAPTPPCGQLPSTAKSRRSPAVSWQPGAGGQPRVEQTAFGVLVSPAVAAPFVGPGEAVFMDWRQPPGFTDPATFLYAVPLPDGRVLLEETCLARRPGLGMAELRDRLAARLGGLPDGDTEKVRFPVDSPIPRNGPIPFGAAAGLIHPATGFSVADTFRLAPTLAAAIRDGRDPRRVLWPLPARLTHRLRHMGLATLLTLTPAEHEQFFDLFFALPTHRQRAYLSGRADLRGTAATMAALFRAAPANLRRKMITR